MQRLMLNRGGVEHNGDCFRPIDHVRRAVRRVIARKGLTQQCSRKQGFVDIIKSASGKGDRKMGMLHSL